MHSTNSHTFKLPKHVSVYMGRQDFVVGYAMGKSVLHLGCVDTGFYLQKSEAGLFLHSKLQRVAKTLWGVDIDLAGLNWMREQGYQNLYHLDIEHLADEMQILAQSFDLLVLTEVLEHLNNYGLFLTSLRPLLRPHTELLITTPNASSLSNVLSNLRHTEVVHPDHNGWFSYQTLLNLLGKYGYKVKQFALYNQYDYTRPWVGKFLPLPAQLNLPTDLSDQQTYRMTHRRTKGIRKPRFGGWLRANTQALLYGLILKRWPFFADGLIVIVGLTD